MAHISVHVGQGRLEGQQQPRAIICEATFSISGTLEGSVGSSACRLPSTKPNDLKAAWSDSHVPGK